MVLSQLPDLTFRLHHYIFAILFMPALGFATRTSAALQAVLIGVFADGVGKFGFDSILQTAAEVRIVFFSSWRKTTEVDDFFRGCLKKRLSFDEMQHSERRSPLS